MQRLADDPDHLRLGLGQPHKSIADQHHRRRVAHVESLGNRRRHRRVEDQLPRLIAAQHDVIDARVLQQLFLQILVNRVIGQ